MDLEPLRDGGSIPAMSKPMTDGRALLELKILYKEALRLTEKGRTDAVALESAKAQQRPGRFINEYGKEIQKTKSQLKEIAVEYAALRKHPGVKRAMESNEDARTHASILEGLQ